MGGVVDGPYTARDALLVASRFFFFFLIFLRVLSLATLGVYLLACFDEDDDQYQSVCKVGTGFSEEDLSTLAKAHEGAVIAVRARAPLVCVCVRFCSE